jgi:hypothetical protein
MFSVGVLIVVAPPLLITSNRQLRTEKKFCGTGTFFPAHPMSTKAPPEVFETKNQKNESLLT